MNVKARSDRGPMRPERKKVLRVKPVNAYVEPVPSPFSRGRSHVSGAAGYITGGKRGRGQRGRGNLSIGKYHSSLIVHPVGTRTDGRIKSPRRKTVKYDGRLDPLRQQQIALERPPSPVRIKVMLNKYPDRWDVLRSA